VSIFLPYDESFLIVCIIVLVLLCEFL
jgi:hypothetical protein